MGIDAELLLRVKGPKPTEAQLTEWSWNLCRSIGAKHFFIKDGLPPAEYHVADAAWHAAFNGHPEYPRWKALGEASRALRWPTRPSEADEAEEKAIAERIRAFTGPFPEMRRRAIELTNALYPIDDEDSDIPHDYRAPGRCSLEDGDNIYAEPGEWLLRVALWTRYYGIGYERGDLLTICAVAEWCELTIPNCVVWYGGDSSGMVAQPFPEEERRKLKRHLYSLQGRDYFAYDKRMGKKAKHPAPCGLCIPGGDFHEFGVGSNYSAVHCAGCGKSFESRDGGVTWAEQEKEKAAA